MTLDYLDSKKIIILPLIIIGFIPASLFLYLYVPILALYHGIQGFCDLKEVQTRLKHIEKQIDITFLKLFEQFGEALPQFILSLTFYINNDYYIKTYENLFRLPTTLISMVFSGVSLWLGLMCGMCAIKKTTYWGMGKSEN